MKHGLLGISSTKNKQHQNKEGARHRFFKIVMYLSDSTLPDKEPLMDNYQCGDFNDARSYGEVTRTPGSRQVVPCACFSTRNSEAR